MKKEELIDAVLNGASLETKKQAQQVIDTIFDTVTQALSRGEEVGITGFGTFRVSKRAARMGINPKTGAKIQIAAKTVARFRPGKLLKEAVN